MRKYEQIEKLLSNEKDREMVMYHNSNIVANDVAEDGRRKFLQEHELLQIRLLNNGKREKLVGIIEKGINSEDVNDKISFESALRGKGFVVINRDCHMAELLIDGPKNEDRPTPREE